MAYSTGTLAQGCFGKVYKEKYNDTWAAVKKVPHHLINRKDLERECEVYNKANHPNIVKLLGNITLRDSKWIIPLEFIFGEDLETTIFKASKSKIQLTPANKGTIIIGMCEGLLHLHSKDIVHQDLKPENIMVEHNTNRAVIIDLGLAKFFRHGLNSAMDMGNEAYSAPEVLQRCSQRDQRSDVWAMGKIIAELCARIRLYTPSVCPAKIKETLQDQPYCKAVCRMVEPDPSLRAAMGGVISEIRRAGGAGIVINTPIQKEHLKPPSPNVNARNWSPSPLRRDPSPFNRDPPPLNRDPPPLSTTIKQGSTTIKQGSITTIGLGSLLAGVAGLQARARRSFPILHLTLMFHLCNTSRRYVGFAGGMDSCWLQIDRHGEEEVFAETVCEPCPLWVRQTCGPSRTVCHRLIDSHRAVTGRDMRARQQVHSDRQGATAEYDLGRMIWVSGSWPRWDRAQ
ncbi:serine/threonine-protein kinase Nek8-like isoform X1 [Lates japonicus]|uniref:Serine/threonine-protein kinase Nek8-like isoform X1 n=1 Tax=Lates japonicus TaxID=270547 RepID=A0AAD3NGN6_LATJO|nr:serine/threonine-protein kinase Nek8-like isoform X1 [Lates japonicus]